MPNKTSIEWTDYTTNPFKASTPDGKTFNFCEKLSPGCAHCYAASIVKRFGGAPYVNGSIGGWQLTPVLMLEEIRKIITFKPNWLRPPSKPMVFAHDMTDIGLDFWPDEFLDTFFAAVALRQDVIFQVLTKRPERLLAYFSTPGRHNTLELAADSLLPGKGHPSFAGKHVLPSLPLPNLWLGVSAEDQRRADERIPLLCQTPAAVRFVSAEPLLGPLDMRFGDSEGLPTNEHPMRERRWLIDQVIVGGESGHGARPMHPDWARGLRDQCNAAGVPFFFKQWGDMAPLPPLVEGSVCIDRDGGSCNYYDVGAQQFARFGKARAGRLLDGREWSEYPAAKGGEA